MVSKIQEHLLSLQDEKYRDFNAKLCNTSKFKMIGVRVPLIRGYAKQLLKEKDDVVFKDQYYEEVMLHSFYIAGYKTDYDNKVKMVEEFLPLIDNWAICDSFCASLKFVDKNKDAYLKQIKKYLKSNKEYYQRFAFSTLIDHYVEDKYLDEIFTALKNVKYNGYYSLMAGAWLLSFCFIYDFDKTLDFIKNNKLNDFVYRKGIQKTIESYRVSDKNKNILRKMKED